MPDYVFLSFSRADRSYVDSLVRRLVAEGIPYWIDQEVDYDDDRASAIEERIAGAAAVIVVVGGRAAASGRVDRAVRQARDLGKPILPLVRRRGGTTLLGGLEPVDVTGGGMPSAGFYDRVRAYTGTAPPAGRPDSWRPRTRLPHRLGPITPTAAELWGVRGLLAAAVFLALAGSFSRNWNLFLIFPAFGIPDLLFAWFRWRRFRVAGRWSADVRATILLTGLTLYLGFAAALKSTASHSPFLLIGVSAAVVLGLAAAVVWIVQVVRDRPRGPDDGPAEPPASFRSF
jgi:hypothetical protein